MGKSFSSDLRVGVYGAIEDGTSRRGAARRFGSSASTSVRIAQRVSATGSASPVRQGRPPGGGKLAPYAAALIRWVEEEGDITMPELVAKLAAEHGVVAHPASLSTFLIKQGFNVKKNRCRPPRSVALTSPRIAVSGERSVSPGCAWGRIGWSSSTRPRPPRR